MNYVVRVQSEDGKWSYTTTGLMESVDEVNQQEGLRRHMLQSKIRADETYLVICSQAQDRRFKAIALSEAYLSNTKISERSVLQYREF